MPKKEHDPIPENKFMDLLRANEEKAVDCENTIKVVVAKGEPLSNISGKLLDFFEKFDQGDEQKMALMMVFFFGMKLGRTLGPEKENESEPKKPKKRSYKS